MNKKTVELTYVDLDAIHQTIQGIPGQPGLAEHRLPYREVILPIKRFIKDTMSEVVKYGQLVDEMKQDRLKHPDRAEEINSAFQELKNTLVTVELTTFTEDLIPDISVSLPEANVLELFFPEIQDDDPGA